MYRWGVLLMAWGVCAAELLRTCGVCCCWPVGIACYRSATHMWGVLLPARGVHAADLQRLCGVLVLAYGVCVLQSCNVQVGSAAAGLWDVCCRAAACRWGVLLLACGVHVAELQCTCGVRCCWLVGCMLQSYYVHVGCAAAGL